MLDLTLLLFISLQSSSIQYGSVDSANAINGQIPSSDRSMTPLLNDFVDPSVCYVPPNGYTSYYYGGNSNVNFATRLI